MDIMKKLDAQMGRVFGKREPEVVDATPSHLRQLPEKVVAELIATILSEMPVMPRTLALELKAFT